MITLSAAVAGIRARPALVLLLDTCSLLDLFRRDSTRQQPRVPASEIRTAAELLQLLTARSDAAHLVVPELVPGEFADHADRIEREFEGWFGFHDDNQNWLAEAALSGREDGRRFGGHCPAASPGDCGFARFANHS
jgi:hypothetical protein